jgi:hypothetical protein
VYAGVREIATTGVLYRELAPARYAVTERYAQSNSPGSAVATLRGTIAYTPLAVPPSGIIATEATIEQREEIGRDASVRVLSVVRATHAANVHDVGTGVRSTSDVRTLERSVPGGETIVPASLRPHHEALPLASTIRRAESDTGAMGSGGVIGTLADSDVRRTTNADGSFEEGGHAVMQPSIHRIRQQADGSATAYDGVPGFSLHDVTVAAPEGAGPNAHVAVTVKTQGRTVGPTPIDTHDYVVPLWYAPTWPAPLATATLTVERPRPPDARCALGSARLVPVLIERRHVDVTGEIVEEREERDLDRARRVLCHLTATTTRYYDVTSGAVTGTITDTTVVHLKAV